MIRLKAKPGVPATLQSDTVTRVRRRLSTKVRARRTLSGKDFPSQYWRADDVRLTLWKLMTANAVIASGRETRNENPT